MLDAVTLLDFDRGTFLRLASLDLSQNQVYALFFLLGSFTVASLSDVRHLSAQREFVEVWGAVAVLLLALDLWDARLSVGPEFWLKWGLVAALCILSLEKVGVLFRLAWGDVLAIAAAAALLSPALILLFALALKVASWPLSRILRKGNAYPFLPVVTMATIAVLVFGLYVLG